jgi:O-antigen biosynthesis protein
MGLLSDFFRRLLSIKLLGKFPLLQKGILSIYREGLVKSIGKARYYLTVNKNVLTLGVIKGNYHRWLQINKLSEKKIQREIEGFQHKPKISIIMPVFNVDPKWLILLIKSVKKQFYSNWELCMVDDCSTNQKTINYLKSIHDSKMKIKFLDRNQGIAVASNAAIKMTEGEYVALLDHDDEITEDALFEVVKAINAKDPDLIYSDEDKIDRHGHRIKPFFKPDWSPDLLRSQNYICHFAVIRKALLDSISGFRQGFEGAQDYDLFLRISEKTKKILHISKILYSWREIETSTACNSLSKPYAQIAGLNAVDEHLKRVFGNEALAKESEYLFVYDARFAISNEPLVTIIIPTKDGVNYLKTCIESIVTKSTYSNYEIIILDNNSEKIETKRWLKKITDSYSRIRVLDASYPFCWSKLNNYGISEANGDVFIFLNNDIEVISNDWIDRLVEQALRDDVGAVGPLLLYEDGTIQHAGVVVGLGGWADHIFKGMKPIHIGSPYVSPMVKRNVLAVTGSCMAISRKAIDRIGKFDENFMVCGSDVEICLRAYEKGLHNIYDPFVKLYHFESRTRIPDDIPTCDFEMSKKHYKKYTENFGDPYFNINLSLNTTTPMLRE